MDEVLPATASVARRRQAAAPLKAWIYALFLTAVIAFVTLGYLTYVNTPFASAADERNFAQQMRLLDERAAALSDPLTVMFIGTSRIKNVAYDHQRVADAARQAGIARPVASSFLSVNWGGFERIDDAVRELAERRPDHVVIMVEFLSEDLAPSGRIEFALRYLRQKFWLQEFKLFDDEAEFEKPACLGFEGGPQRRFDIHRAWVAPSLHGAGPVAAAAALRVLANKGITVYVADIPVRDSLALLRPERWPVAAVLKEHGLDKLANIRPLPAVSGIPQVAFCDYAHMEPAQAGHWLRPLFEILRTDGAG